MPFTPKQQPNGRWVGGFRHPVTKQRIFKAFDYAYEAEAWASVAEQKARDERDEIAPPTKINNDKAVASVWVGPTLVDYGVAYCADRAGMLAWATRDKYARAIRGLRIPYGDVGSLGDYAMGAISKRTVERWVTAQREAGVGAPTINIRLSFARRLFRDAVAAKLVDADPTATIRKLAEPKKDDRILTDAEGDALIEAGRTLTLPGDHHDVAFMLGLDCGLRWGEVFALRVGSLRRTHGSASGAIEFVSVTGAIERGTRNPRPWPKDEDARRVPTSERLAEALEPMVFGRHADDLLFTTAKGLPWEYSNHRKRVWHPCLTAIGCADVYEIETKHIRKTGPGAGTPAMQKLYTPHFGFHQLRHTYGSMLSDAGVPRARIAELMGHSDERTTARYIHKSDDGALLASVRDAQARRRELRVVA